MASPTDHEAIVPTPRRVIPGRGSLRFPSAATVYAGPGAEHAGAAASRDLGVAPADDHQAADLQITIAADKALPSGYVLIISPEGAQIIGGDAAGAFYGVQTMRQLLPPDARSVHGHELAAVQIDDAPHLPWRGLMIDTARHFKPLDWLKRVVDLMALHKLNVLHLPLTDDQGWRLEIPAYPRLTEVGAWRSESVAGHYRTGQSELTYDGTPHGGFYTQAELRELVAYAAERAVEVVPEIDMPGHMQAAIAAYPWLATERHHDQAPQVRREWGISSTVLGLHPATMQFCRDVLTEVMAIFPSIFIHCGGDECPKADWESDGATQQQIADLGLDGEEALQGWFTQQVAAFLAESGRRLIGWDEIRDGGPLPDDVAVMGWRTPERGVDAAKAGHDVVMAPTSHTYFDYYQHPDWAAEPLAFPADLPLETVYAFEPVPDGLDPMARQRIMGGQAQLWSEYIPDTADAEYKLFPRLSALADSVWRAPDTPRDFGRFLPRLRRMQAQLDAMGVQYRPLDP